MIITGKVAIVFGGARNIGKEYVKHLLENSGKVCIADILVEDGQQSEQEFLKLYPGSCLFVKCDVTKDGDVTDVFKRCQDYFGGTVEICMNSVGICNENNYEKTIQVNYISAVRITYTALEYMGKDKGYNGGVIIHTSSINAFRQAPAIPVYCGTKSALVSFIRSLGTDGHFSKNGVRFHAICPGLVRTSFQDIVETLQVGDFQGNELDKPDIKPSACAEAMIRLVKDDSLNGQVLVITATKGIISHNCEPQENKYNDLW